MTFQRALETGKVAEGLIAAWLQSRGSAVLPAYEIEKSCGKGPQLFAANGDFVSPDMLCFTANGICWIEAKHKSHFTWHRATQRWTTGIDIRHYGEYLSVEKLTQLPVWLMFYHRESTPSDEDRRYGCPAACPTGLFGGKLIDLIVKENHRSLPKDTTRQGYLGHGRSGMVYWAPDAFRMLATKSEVLDAADSVNQRKQFA